MSKAELEVLASKLDDLFAKNGYAVTPEVVQMARQLDGIIAREIGNWTTEKGSSTGSNLAELLAPSPTPRIGQSQCQACGIHSPTSLVPNRRHSPREQDDQTYSVWQKRVFK